jgi:hypothetical protein
MAEQTFMTRGGPKTESQLRTELQAAGYPGPWDINSMLAAYERAGAPLYAPKNASEADLEYLMQNPAAAARRALRDAGMALGLGPFSQFLLSQAQRAFYNASLSGAFGGDTAPSHILGAVAQFMKNYTTMPAQQGFEYAQNLYQAGRQFLKQAGDILARTGEAIPPDVSPAVAGLITGMLQNPQLQTDYAVATLPYVGPYTGYLARYADYLYDLYSSENPEMNPNFLRYLFNRVRF